MVDLYTQDWELKYNPKNYLGLKDFISQRKQRGNSNFVGDKNKIMPSVEEPWKLGQGKVGVTATAHCF